MIIIMSYSLYIKGPWSPSKTIVYNTDNEKATIRDLKRFIRASFNIKINSLRLHSSKNFTDESPIFQVFENNSFVNTYAAVLSGSSINTTETLTIQVGFDHPIKSLVYKTHPSNTIFSIIQAILEQLDEACKLINYQTEKYELYHPDSDTILNPCDELAFYPKLSASYVQFIPSYVLKNDIIGKLLPYYHLTTFDNRPNEIPTLILRLKTIQPKKNNHKCGVCHQSIHHQIILPICRHSFCHDCVNESVKCPICSISIKEY